MLSMQPNVNRLTGGRRLLDRRPAVRTGTFARRRPRISRFLPFILLMVILTACAPGEAPPPAICDTYERALFTTQLMGGATLLLALAIVGFKKNVSAILPSQGAQVGAVAGAVILGLILLAFSTDIGNQILTGFGIESLYTLCGLS